MDGAYWQILGSTIATLVAVGAAVLSAWLTNRHAEKRQRTELASQERRHQDELRARFFDALMSPRVQAHAEVVARLYDLEVATHYFLSDSTNDTYRKEFDRSRNMLRIALGSARVWIRTSALEALANVDAQAEVWSRGESPDMGARKPFVEARGRLEWSLGLEELEFYMRELGHRPAES